MTGELRTVTPLMNLIIFLRRYSMAVLLLIGVALYYFRFSLHPDGMALYPKSAACMLNSQPMASCSPSFTYPPLFGFMMIPFVYLPMWLRNVLWYAVLIGCTWGSFRLAESLVSQSLGIQFDKQELTRFRFVSLALVLNFVLADLENQAYDVLVFFFVLIGLTGLTREKPVWSIIGFGLGAALKATPLLFFPYILFRKGWKLFTLCVLCYLTLSLLPDLFLNVEDGLTTYYGNWIRQVALQPFFPGDSGGMQQSWEGENNLNQSLRAFVYRITLGIHIQQHFIPILYGVYGLCLLYMLWVFSRSVKLHNYVVLDGSLLLIGMLLLSPMSSKSHFVTLMLPFMVVTAYMMTDQRLRTGLILTSVLSSALNNLTSKDLVGRQLSVMAGYWGSVTLGTITLALVIGYLVSFKTKKQVATRRAIEPQAER
jgi:glycosyl transferase family 87